MDEQERLKLERRLEDLLHRDLGSIPVRPLAWYSRPVAGRPAHRFFAVARAAGLLALVLVVALGAVLALRQLRPVPATTPVPSAPVLPSPSPSASPQAAACRSDQLTGTYESNGAASGSYVVSFRLAVATGSCEVPANPPVRFLDASGALILSAASPSAAGPVQTIRASTVGKDAGFLLIQWSGHGTEPGYRCVTMGPPVVSVEVDLASVRGGTALVPSNVLTLNIPSAQRFGLCTDPPERVSASIVGSRQP